MLVTPHGFTALHPPVRCPAVKKWSVCITAPMGATQPARFSAGVAMGVARRWYGSSWAYCKQRLQEESGYWNRRLGRWLGQSRVKRSGMDDPAESRLVVLCTGKGQPHAEYGDSPSYPLPPPPPCHPLGMLCLRASWRSPTWNLVIPLSWSHGARPSPNRIRHSNRNASNCSLCAYLPGKKFGRMGWEADADIPILVSAWVFKANVFKQLNFKWGICSAVRKANCLHWRQIKHCK